MAIRIQNSTIIDDSRNIVDAGIGTFTNALNVGAAGTIFSATTRISTENILSVRNAANNPALEVTGIGSVGIGISNPTRALHVDGNGFVVSSGSTTVFSAETYSGSGNLLSVVGINSYPAMEISGIGSVGIGTTRPTRALHVEGNGVLFTNNNNTLLSVESFSGQSDKVLDVRDNNNNTIVGVTTNTFTVSSPIQPVFTVETTSGSSILSIKNTSDLPALEVTGIGSVGIGRTNPTRSLHVEGSGLLVSTGSTTVFSVDTFGGGTNTFEILGPTNDILLGISTNVVSLAGTTGRVGVGSTLPNNELEVVGDLSAYDLRIQSASERLTIVNGNTVTLNYSLGGGNVAVCTNPSGPITLNVIGIPTDSTFNSRLLRFSVIVNQGVTGYACSTVNLNGVPETIRYSSGSVPSPTTNSIDIFNFIGINTIGSASSAANYLVLGTSNTNFI